MVQLLIKHMLSIANKLEMELRKGKHTNTRLIVDGVVVVSTCWPHGRGEIPKSTANKILKHQLMLDTDEQAFALRDCTMSRSDYLNHLIRKKVLSP